jgi:hypothetical protein
VSTTPDGRSFEFGFDSRFDVGSSPLVTPVQRGQRIGLSNQRFEEKGDDDRK